MIRLKEELGLAGNASGWRVYRLKGIDKTIIARKGGPTAEQIKSSKNYETLRKNQKEFGAASILAKLIRQSLPDYLSRISESYVSGKLTAKFRAMAKESEGETGQRPLLLSKFGAMLEGFEFNSSSPYDTRFSSPPVAKMGSTRGQLIVHSHSYTPQQAVNPPEGADHYKVFTHLIMLSDYVYQKATGNYEPMYPDFHAQFTTFKSDLLPIVNISVEPKTQQLSLYQGEPVPTETGMVLISAIVFYQKSGNKMVEVKEGNTMKISRVL